MPHATSNHRRSQDQQDIPQDRTDQGRFGDVMQTFEQSCECNDELRRIA